MHLRLIFHFGNEIIYLTAESLVVGKLLGITSGRSHPQTYPSFWRRIYGRFPLMLLYHCICLIVRQSLLAILWYFNNLDIPFIIVMAVSLHTRKPFLYAAITPLILLVAVSYRTCTGWGKSDRGSLVPTLTIRYAFREEVKQVTLFIHWIGTLVVSF